MTALDPRLVAVEPTGTTTVNAFWDGYDAQGNHVGGFGPIERSVYPKSARAEALAALRKSKLVSLGRAADALGLSPENLSGLEHGRYTFRRDADWGDAATVVADLGGKR